MMSDELTLAELARMAGYKSPATLRQAYYRGNFKAWMRFGRIVSTVEELQHYLDQRPSWKADGRKLA